MQRNLRDEFRLFLQRGVGPLQKVAKGYFERLKMTRNPAAKEVGGMLYQLELEIKRMQEMVNEYENQLKILSELAEKQSKNS